MVLQWTHNIFSSSGKNNLFQYPTFQKYLEQVFLRETNCLLIDSLFPRWILPPSLLKYNWIYSVGLCNDPNLKGHMLFWAWMSTYIAPVRNTRDQKLFLGFHISCRGWSHPPRKRWSWKDCTRYVKNVRKNIYCPSSIIPYQLF